jgi:hypothetical protein
LHKVSKAADAAVAAAQQALSEEGEEVEREKSEKGQEEESEEEEDEEEEQESETDEQQQQQQQEEDEEEETAPASQQQKQQQQQKGAASPAANVTVVSSQPPVALKASNETATAAAATAAAPSNSSSNSSNSSNSTATMAATAAAPTPDAPVHWGGGSGVLNPTDGEGSWIESSLVAITGFAVIGIMGGCIWRFWSQIKASVQNLVPGWFKRGVLERAGFRPVATSDGEGFGRRGDLPGADSYLMGVGAYPGGMNSSNSSRGRGGGGNGSRGSGKVPGREIALTASAHPAAAAANGLPLQLVVDGPEDEGQAGDQQQQQQQQGYVGLDAVKSPPGGRDQTSTPQGVDSSRTAAAAAAGGGGSVPMQLLPRLPPPLQQQQYSQQQQQFVAEFSLGDDHAAPTAAAAVSDISSSISDAPLGSVDSLLNFQPIDLEDRGEAPSRQS